MTDTEEFNLDKELLNTDFIPADINLEEHFGINTSDNKSNNADEFDKLLDDFINNHIEDIKDTQNEIQESIKDNKPDASVLSGDEEFINNLYPEERRFYDAYINFRIAIGELAEKANLTMPKLQFSAQAIYPRFRPSRGRIASQDIVQCWELMLAAQPIRLSGLPQNATDEQILDFAEKTTEESLQMALISYVEILIEMEGCEIAYNLRKAKAEKRKIERRIYEEHQKQIETKRRYIEAIKKKEFPIDADRLVTNFFKTARKDPDGAQKILENNPATFAPIETDKLKPRFFGMINPKPEDGIRINKEIGKFLKNLKA